MGAENVIETELRLNIADLKTKLDEANNSVKGFGSHLETASSKGSGALGGLNVAMLAAGAGVGLLGAGLLDSVGKAGEFDQGMAAIRSTMNASQPEMDALRKTALDLGAANDVGSVSAKDAADAIFELGKAGISSKAITDGFAKSTLQLAAAAGPEFGVANAATLAADAMNTFGLQASDSKMIVDGFVGAANASSIGLSELKFAMAAVGPVAAQAGVSLQDFDVAMAEFGMHGLKGSDAGTSFKTMLLNLTPHTKGATSAMMDLGLITEDGKNQFYDATGKLKGLADVQQILQDATKNLTAQEKTATLQRIFGTDAIRAAAIMANGGAREFGQYADAVKKQGDAAKVAGDMSNNFKGKMEALGGTIDTMKISIGSALIPALSDLAVKANELVGGAIAALPIVFANVQAAAGQVSAFVQANMIPILAVLAAAVYTVVVPAFVAWASGAIAAAGATIAALAPILIPIAAVAAAVALLKMAWDSNFLGMRDTLIPIMTAITTALSAFWVEIQPKLKAAWDAISSTVRVTMENVGKFIGDVMKTLKDAWRTDWGGIREIVNTVWGVISTIVKVAWNLISGIIKTGLDLLSGNWKGAWGDITTALGRAWDDIKLLVSGALTDLWNKISSWAGQTAKDAVGLLAGVGKGMVDGIMAGFRKAWDAFLSWVQSLFNGLPDWVKNFLGLGGGSNATSLPPGGSPASFTGSTPLGSVAPLGGSSSAGGRWEQHIHVYLDGKELSQGLGARTATRFRQPSVVTIG